MDGRRGFVDENLVIVRCACVHFQVVGHEVSQAGPCRIIENVRENGSFGEALHYLWEIMDCEIHAMKLLWLAMLANTRGPALL